MYTTCVECHPGFHVARRKHCCQRNFTHVLLSTIAILHFPIGTLFEERKSKVSFGALASKCNPCHLTAWEGGRDFLAQELRLWSYHCAAAEGCKEVWGKIARKHDWRQGQYVEKCPGDIGKVSEGKLPKSSKEETTRWTSEDFKSKFAKHQSQDRDQNDVDWFKKVAGWIPWMELQSLEIQSFERLLSKCVPVQDKGRKRSLAARYVKPLSSLHQWISWGRRCIARICAAKWLRQDWPQGYWGISKLFLLLWGFASSSIALPGDLNPPFSCIFPPSRPPNFGIILKISHSVICSQ